MPGGRERRREDVAGRFNRAEEGGEESLEEAAGRGRPNERTSRKRWILFTPVYEN